MNIDRFTTEVNRIKTKFESGDKPSGKDFNDMITLFYDFYSDMVLGYTEICATSVNAAIAAAINNKTVNVNDLGNLSTNTTLDLSESSLQTATITSSLTFNLGTLPDAGKSTTVLLQLTAGNTGITLSWDSDLTTANWVDGLALGALTNGKTYIVSITTNGDDATKCILTYQQLNS